MSELLDLVHNMNRLSALNRTGLLDTPAEEPFDRFTRLAARICRTPIALMTLVGLVLYLALAVAWLYLGFLVGQNGRSPGMAIMGLRCVSQETGQLIGGGMGVVRTIAHIIDSLICYIGWLFPLWDVQRQTIADKLVKTVVLTNQPKQSFSIELLKP